MTEIKHTRREVIENKLLAALNDDDKVAIVASKADLYIMIEGLDAYADTLDCIGRPREDIEPANNLKKDLRELYLQEFGGEPWWKAFGDH